QVEGALIRVPLLGDLTRELGERFRAGELDREDPVPAGGASEGAAVGPAGGDPDRDSRCLHGPGFELACPELPQPGQPFVEAAGALTRIGDLAEGFELAVVAAAEPDPEDE